MSRTIEYYTDEELQAIAREKKEIDEKPFVGIWAFSNTIDMGNGDRYDYTSTIALNLYEKFVPDGVEIDTLPRKDKSEIWEI